DAGAHRLARLVDVQRVRVVALEAAHHLDDRAHARPSSSRVLMLRKASASSSKLTSTTLSDAYHASILRPPPARNACRFSATERRTSASTCAIIGQPCSSARPLSTPPMRRPRPPARTMPLTPRMRRFYE